MIQVLRKCPPLQCWNIRPIKTMQQWSHWMISQFLLMTRIYCDNRQVISHLRAAPYRADTMLIVVQNQHWLVIFSSLKLNSVLRSYILLFHWLFCVTNITRILYAFTGQVLFTIECMGENFSFWWELAAISGSSLNCTKISLYHSLLTICSWDPGMAPGYRTECSEDEIR